MTPYWWCDVVDWFKILNNVIHDHARSPITSKFSDTQIITRQNGNEANDEMVYEHICNQNYDVYFVSSWWCHKIYMICVVWCTEVISVDILVYGNVRVHQIAQKRSVLAFGGRRSTQNAAINQIFLTNFGDTINHNNIKTDGVDKFH